MEIYRSLSLMDRAVVAGGSLTIGNFDGVHLGHQRIVATAAGLARPAVVMTFNPHPMAVINPAQAPPTMTPEPLKLALLERAGADAAVVVPTDRALLELEAEWFVQNIIAGLFAPRAVVEGPSFGFGHARRGDVQMLRRLADQYGFSVHVVEQVSRVLPGHERPATVSSTLVRRLISGGSVEAAEACLGRPYRLIGRHVCGHGRGRGLGFPTINLDVGRQLLPADGIYAAVAGDGAGANWPAAVSVGPVPTFDQREPAVEAHLLDFAGEFAAGRLELDLVGRLRGIEKYDSPEKLAEQIGRDVADVRRVLAERAGGAGGSE